MSRRKHLRFVLIIATSMVGIAIIQWTDPYWHHDRCTAVDAAASARGEHPPCLQRGGE